VCRNPHDEKSEQGNGHQGLVRLLTLSL
jgi:hypothetical protein